MILNADQTLIRDMARDFASEKIKPFAAQWAQDKAFPAGMLTEMGELGFFGMTVPTQWDGAETDYVSYAVALMEIAAGDGALSTLMSVTNSPVCAVLLSSGNDAQKELFLKPLARGEHIGAFCLTESDAGSDAAALKARARKTNGGYVINGAKQFISSAVVARTAIVFAVTDPEAGKKGISAFIVPTDTPGFSVDKVEHKMGQTASDTCGLRFDDMLIPADYLLGEEGEGYKIALANLEAGRIGIAAQSVGMARAALDYAIAYAKDRTSFGKKIIDHQAVGFRLADMSARLEAATQLVLHAAALKDAGEPCLQQACMAKLIASETAEHVCSAAIQTLGGYGYLSEYTVERIARDVRVCQIYEGTSDIQRMIIARNL
jgi:alkylation response protein AidB-like acyl-CoA dehydrogenase